MKFKTLIFLLFTCTLSFSQADSNKENINELLNKRSGLTNEEIIVGLLHDFIKTAPTQKCVYRRKSLLHDFFGTDIYNAVLALTRHKNEERINYLKRVKDNNLAKQIKIYDIQSNLNIYHLSLLDTKTQVKLINDYNRDLSFLTDISNSSTTLCL